MQMRTLGESGAARVRMMGEAQADKVARVGIAEAVAIEEQVRAYGGPRYQVTQNVMKNFTDAIATAKVDVVPKIVMSGNGGGGSGANGSVMETLLALLLSDKLGGAGDGALGESSKLASPGLEASQATIGPAGGKLASSDGVLSLIVPPGALTADTQIGIQPITNLAPGAVGTSYRLTPEGQVFATPAQLVFAFTDTELAGSVLAVLRIAYQDDKGQWRAPKSVARDASAHSVSVTTMHFSDWSKTIGLKLRAPESFRTQAADSLRRTSWERAPAMTATRPSLRSSRRARRPGRRRPPLRRTSSAPTAARSQDRSRAPPGRMRSPTRSGASPRSDGVARATGRRRPRAGRGRRDARASTRARRPDARGSGTIARVRIGD